MSPARVSSPLMWMSAVTCSSQVGSAPTCPVCDSRSKARDISHWHGFSLRQCCNCGLVYQPQPLLEAETADIYDEQYYTHWGVKQHFEDVWAMKVKTCLAYLDLVKPDTPPNPLPLKMLDIGCAHGFMLEAGQQRGFQVAGIEISPAARIARERGFTIYDQPIQELCLPSESFDIITIIDVIEHIPDPVGFMSEIRRVLKPKCPLLIVTPDVESWTARVMAAKWPHYKAEHVLYFSERSLALLVKQAGFALERIGTGFKYLSFNYILGHFEKFTPGWMTALLHSLCQVLPRGLTRVPMRFPTEMLAVARYQTQKL